MALVAVLAYTQGPVGRDTLAALLWPDYAWARPVQRRTERLVRPFDLQFVPIGLAILR